MAAKRRSSESWHLDMDNVWGRPPICARTGWTVSGSAIRPSSLLDAITERSFRGWARAPSEAPARCSRSSADNATGNSWGRAAAQSCASIREPERKLQNRIAREVGDCSINDTALVRHRPGLVRSRCEVSRQSGGDRVRGHWPAGRRCFALLAARPRGWDWLGAQVSGIAPGQSRTPSAAPRQARG